MNPFAFLEANAQSNPTGVALIGPGVTMSNLELFESSRAIAWLLKEGGVKRGDLVLLRLSQEVECAAMLAAFYIGAISAHAPLSPDSSQVTKLGFMWLVTSDPRDQLDGLTSICLSAENLAAAGLPDDSFQPIEQREITDAIRIIFSSGTTGTPKAVPFTVEQLLARSEFLRDHVMTQQPFMCALGFDVSFGFMTFFASIRFNRAYLVPGDSQYILRQIDQLPLRSLATSPIGLEKLLSTARAMKSAPVDLAAITTTGGFLSEDTISQALDFFGCQATSLYGSTEVGFVASRTGAGNGPGDCGELFSHSSVEIVDEEDFPVAPGKTGTIRVRTPWKGNGYFNDAQATKQYFRDGYFYPGDTGVVEGNRLRLVGRNNLVVNAGGVKIDPVPVEGFCKQELGCEEAVGFEHTEPGGSKRFVMAIVCNQSFDQERAFEKLRSKFGPSCPTRFFLIPLIPKNSLGKPLRQIISRQLALIDEKSAPVIRRDESL